MQSARNHSEGGAAAAVSQFRGPQWQSLDWLYVLVVLVCGAVMFVPGINSFGIIDPSDGLYSEGAREMLELNNFLTPHFNYTPYYEKPILIYWLIIASYKLFGVSEWAARLPSVLSAIATAVVTFALSRYFIRRRAALFAAIMLMANPLYAVVGHVVLTDMPLTFCITTAMLCLFRRLNGDSALIGYLAYVVLGLAVLTKGPLAILLVFAVLATYLLIMAPWSSNQRWHWWWHQIKRLQLVIGLVIVLVISLPWYVYEIVSSNGQFFQEFFIHQNLGRLAGSVNHQAPWWFYIPFVAGGFFPWIVFIFLVPKSVWCLLKTRSVASYAKRLSYCSICWTAMVLLVFSAISTKLATYVLPAFAPLAILCGIFLDRWILEKPQRNLFWVGPALMAILLGGMCFLPMLAQKMTVKVSTGTALILVLALISMFLGLSLYTFFVYKRKLKNAVYSLLVCTALGIGALVPTAIFIYDKALDQPLRDLVFKAKSAKASVALYLRDSPAVLFYTRTKVPFIQNEVEFQSYLKDTPGPHWLLVTGDVVSQVQSRPGAVNLIDQRGKWYLFALD